MKINYKLKKVLSVVLSVVVLVGTVGLIASIATNETKSAGAQFKIGGLNSETGKFFDTKQSIYTEKFIDSHGLRIEPDFESTVKYDIYYYDSEGKFISAIEGLTDLYNEDFEIAPKCRIVIHPEIPKDVKKSDFKIGIFDVPQYASMLKITNSKYASGINYENLLKKSELVYGTVKISSDGSIYDVNTEDADPGSCVSPVIDIPEEADGIVIYVKLGYPPESYGYFYLANEEGEIIDTVTIWASVDSTVDGWNVIKLAENEIDEASYFRLSFDNSEALENFYVYTYND